MKIPPGILLCATLSLFLGANARAENTTQLLSDAQSAYLRGDLVEAKRNFELVNQLDPKNVTAIGYLKILKAQQASQSGGAMQEKKLASLILPQVQLRETSLTTAVKYIEQQAAKSSGGKVALSFVFQIPEETKNMPVTLSLNAVPVTEAIRYLGDLASVSFTYESYAIVIRPKGGVTSSPSASPVLK